MRIKLTEAQLHRVIKESVNQVLNEISPNYLQKRLNWAEKNGVAQQDIYRAENMYNDIYGDSGKGPMNNPNVHYDMNPNGSSIRIKGDNGIETSFPNYYNRMSSRTHTGNGDNYKTVSDDTRLNNRHLNNDEQFQDYPGARNSGVLDASTMHARMNDFSDAKDMSDRVNQFTHFKTNPRQFRR
jgi:hypothetical protein